MTDYFSIRRVDYLLHRYFISLHLKCQALFFEKLKYIGLLKSYWKTNMSKTDDSAQSMPPTERESDVLFYLGIIKSVKEDIVFFENVRKVIEDEPSEGSFERSIQLLRGSQDKLYKALQVKYGVDMERADKIIAGKSEADMLTKLRERVAAYGDEAVKVFENSGQFDAGVVKDLANRAVDVQGVPEQATQSSTEQERIAANLIELKNQEKAISRRLADFRKSLKPEEIRDLERAREQKGREYKEKFDEVVKRPDKEQIIKLWENAIKLELKIEREAEGKEQEKSLSKSK